MNILKKIHSVGLIIAGSIIFLPMNVQSGEAPLRGPISFAIYDKDGDGLISEKEFNLVREERMATKAAKGRAMRRAASAPLFSEFDKNADGQLTQDELVVGQKARMEKRREMKKGQGRKMNKGMRSGRNRPVFADYDLDGDGKILEEEFNTARNKRITEKVQKGYKMRKIGNAPSFSDFDSNADGQISAEEFSAHQSQRRRQRAR